MAVARLTQEHDLEPQAAENVLRYLVDQELATTIVPDDRNIVIERVRDELGYWRVCVLTPFGSRIHAPWAMAMTSKVRANGGVDVETMWSEDGFVLRFPETDLAPDVEQLMLGPEEAAELVLRQLGSTALFAAKFRESAARALLLPRRRADGRSPLWQQRKRAYDLLSVASRYASFPILLEAYRECLRDVFDMPALMETLRLIGNRSLRVHTVDSRTPSPFASALLFSYVANYIYDGDAPLAERRAQALSIDQDQLRELMGDADLRELLDIHAIEETEEQLQCVVESYKARSMDGVHDLLLRLGDVGAAAAMCNGNGCRYNCEADAGSTGAADADRRGEAADCRGGCVSVSGCAGGTATVGIAYSFSECGAGCDGRSGAQICPDAWAVHHGRSRFAFRPACTGSGGCAAAAGADGSRGRGRLQAGWNSSRVVR